MFTTVWNTHRFVAVDVVDVVSSILVGTTGAKAVIFFNSSAILGLGSSGGSTAWAGGPIATLEDGSSRGIMWISFRLCLG